MKRVNINKRLQHDTEEIDCIIRLASYLPYLRRFNLDTTYEIYKPLLQEQCNFTRELQNQNQYNRNFCNDPSIVIPTLYPEISTTETLVMDYINGVRIEELTVEQKKHFMDIAGNLMILSLLIHGFIHCDSHMGNVLFIINEDKYKIALIDFGMCCSLSVTEIDQFYDFFNAIANKNYKDTGRYFMEYFTDNIDYMDIDPKLHSKLVTIFKQIFYVNKCFSLIEITQLYTILSKHNIHASETWKKLELALAALDGGFRELQCGRTGLTDILMKKTKEIGHLQIA